jgi:hypothetical protein
VTIHHGTAPAAIVTDPVTVSDPGLDASGGFNLSATEGKDSGSQTLATFTDPGGSEAIGDYSATVNWGDGSSSAGTIALGADAQTFSVSASHTYARERGYTVSVTLHHGTATDSTVTSSATVSDPALAVTGGFNLSATEGSDSGSQTLATFTDPGGPEAFGNYSAAVNWGDGTLSAGTITIGADGLTFTVSGNHTYAQEGSYAVSVTLHHGTASDTTVSDSATVNDPALSVTGGFSLSATEGQDSGSQTLATFTDFGGAEALGNYNATVNWGDGTSSVGTITLGADSLTFTVSGSHTYAQEGSYAVSVTLHHGTASDTTVSDSATVNDPALSAVGGFNLSATEGSSSASQTLATFTDLGGPETVGNYIATVNWGDGTASNGTIAFGADGHTFTVSGSHTYSQEGSYSISVTLHHGTGLDSTVSDSATVGDPALAATGGFSVTAMEGSASGSETLATFTDPGGPEAVGNYSAKVNWGDGTTSTGAIVLGPDGQTFSVSGSHTYAQEGSYTLSITVHHGTAADSTVSGSATVGDPSVVATGGFQLTAAQWKDSGSQTLATFTDPGGPEPVGNYSATVNWGDGTASSGTIVLGADGQTFTVSANHTYAASGNFAGQVSISYGTSAGVTTSFTAAVNSAGIILSGTRISAVAGAPFNGEVASFNPGGWVASASAFRVSINWGDGSATSTGVITLSGGVFHVTGSHTYATLGSYNISVTVTDASGNANIVGSIAQVADLGMGVQRNQVEEIGWWHNKRGQALIQAFNGGPKSTALASWLAINFANLYGAAARGHSLVHANGCYFTNTEVAAFYQSLFAEKGPKLDAELLATALNIYASTRSLGGSEGAKYSFRVTDAGLGACDIDVRCLGSLLGVSNCTRLNVYQLLQAVNRRAPGGTPCPGDRPAQAKLSAVLASLNDNDKGRR